VGEEERNHWWNLAFAKWFQIPCEKFAPKSLLEISQRDGECGHDGVEACLRKGVSRPKGTAGGLDRSAASMRSIYLICPSSEKKYRPAEDFLAWQLTLCSHATEGAARDGCGRRPSICASKGGCAPR
jgi:hypothetical protein